MEALDYSSIAPTALERDDDSIVGRARALLVEQAAALEGLAGRVDERFAEAVELFLAIKGRVVVTGVGKSAHVGRKLAATLASTGTPAFFMHAADGVHGDLGMITAEDAVLLLSYSGETDEVLRLLPSLDRLGVPTVAIVGNPQSSLGRSVHVALDAGVPREICPNNLAPTSSTLAAMAMGDTLAVTLSRLRAFRAEDFARFHPGGALGKKLNGKVADFMRTEELPLLPPSATVEEALVATVRGCLGVSLVVDEDTRVLLGVIGPRELELALQQGRGEHAISVASVDYPSVLPTSSIEHAMKRARLGGLPALPVLDAERRLVGVVKREG